MLVESGAHEFITERMVLQATDGSGVRVPGHPLGV